MQLMSTSCQVLLQNAPSYILQGSSIRPWENNSMSCFAVLKYFLLTKYPLADDSTSRVFPLYVNKFSLKQSVLEKIGYHNSIAS